KTMIVPTKSKTLKWKTRTPPTCLDAGADFAHGAIADGFHVLDEVVAEDHRLFARLLNALERVVNGMQGGVVAAAADRAVKVSKFAGMTHNVGVDMIDQIADALFGVGQEVAQGHTFGSTFELHGAALPFFRSLPLKIIYTARSRNPQGG